MTVPKKQKDLKPTQDLDELTSPEGMADLLIRTYPNPFEELARRKAVTQKEGHQKNIHFWQAVENIISSNN